MSYQNKELTDMLNELERKYERDVRAALAVGRAAGYEDGFVSGRAVGHREGREAMKHTIIETLDRQIAESEGQTGPVKLWILAGYSRSRLGTIQKYIKSFT